MSGSLLRSVCVCAAALTVAVAAPMTVALAEPLDPSDSSDSSELSELSEPSASAQPSGTAAELLARLQDLYRQAEEAGEAYNATEEQLKVQRADTARLSRQLASARNALHDSRGAAGRLARQQYQGQSELSAYVRLLLAPDPQRALDQDHLIERAASDRLATMARLEAGAKRAEQLAAASRKALDKEQVLAEEQRTARDTADARLREVEAMLATLSPEELAELTALERSGTAEAQDKLLSTGVLDGPRTPSPQGMRALEYAVDQIGKPYVWGAEGPESYDCSGLTSQAWGSAGRSIPRTSQEQWAELRRVPLRSLRPGDLVLYFPKATHVAIYLGDGLVVQAPRPGARVKVSPIAANPLLGAVRPDPTSPPLREYTAPPLPHNATTGEDTGYGEASAPSSPTDA
ncbi:NlpC/P60 family protein [Streptomyces sp. NPDC051907]|uniref:C40 family peptidase n=1 Tax=Streptomyces sp. NPDC051907 TaxID=3155284 RepID=UPI00342718EF